MSKTPPDKTIMEIKAYCRADGFKLEVFNGQDGFLKYPGRIFENFPQPEKDFLIDNLVYARTGTLPLVLNKGLAFNTRRPFLKKFIDWGIEKDLGRIADITKGSAGRLSAILKRRPARFSLKPAIDRLPNFKKTTEKGLLALSFGKESLLSYGLANEIGLDFAVTTDFDEENYTRRSWRQRKSIFKKFQQKEKKAIIGFRDNLDCVHFNKEFIKRPIGELENINGMLAFALELMPIAYHAGAKYIIFGNERNLNHCYLSRENVKCYPSFDQTTAYTKKLNRKLSELTGGRLEIISLVEAVYNLAEIKILYSRYRGLLEYAMSCYPKEDSAGRWCLNCPMCALAFLYAAAVGGDPKKMGIDKNMFGKKDKNLYPIFSDKISGPYEKPREAKEEQLLAFLLAYRRGWRGDLIELFKEKYLCEALRREKELRQKFFGVYKPVNLPKNFQGPILKIFDEELKILR